MFQNYFNIPLKLLGIKSLKKTWYQILQNFLQDLILNPSKIPSRLDTKFFKIPCTKTLKKPGNKSFKSTFKESWYRTLKNFLKKDPIPNPSKIPSKRFGTQFCKFLQK